TVGLEVIDTGMVVHMLPATNKVETVERGLAPLAVESGRDVVAGERRSERDRMRREAATVGLRRMNAGDVVRRQGFLLQFVVLYRGSSRGQELRHGVGQVRRAVRARIMLDHRHLRAVAGDDHVAWMDGRIGTGRDKEEVDRLFDSRVT